ncbi:23S rRNA (guanosine(2251)-2'-O)-methyltransferase RlmB [Metamycoplasma phocicerebrale]|uniref:23S rRNA (Guanosine(2251)-2'-O)-methyltransferase RlmB n=1 Tax=Metamycoplasma phocicerebrale TaxID=142649 RepID=A0A3Q9V8F9_9BACT|nr:23S rRNA (guanosine(2251)-2'-O)-methyltransferase RlmB [Metamycoplasma phocicerebrale]AZZ65445.1 23S rRNA (guanosine(2251)-2'-O)-methyltransferase RlmB [Metamycoplasma phocicerebrale]
MKNFIYGKNSVLEALENNYPILEIYLLKGTDNKKIKFNKISYLSMSEMNKIINGNHQGYIAKIAPFQYYDIGTIIKDKPNHVLILDHIQDPQNFGAIIRSANVFGIKHIIIPKDRAVEVTPTVLKISSGGFKTIKIIKVASLLESIEFLKKNGFWMYATALNEKATSLNKIKFSNPSVIIVGNEGTGVSKTLLKKSDEIIYISQKANSVQSLNVSVATGIVLYELTKEK